MLAEIVKVDLETTLIVPIAPYVFLMRKIIYSL